MSDFLDLQRPVSLFDQNFGMWILGDVLLNPSIIAPLRVGYYRPWRNQAAHQSGVSQIQNDEDGFAVSTVIFTECGLFFLLRLLPKK